MSKIIRISEDTYEQLKQEAVGFETPSKVIDRLLNPPQPAAEVIKYLLENWTEIEDAYSFLELWNEGSFSEMREGWQDLELPDELFLGVESGYKPKPIKHEGE